MGDDVKKWVGALFFFLKFFWSRGSDDLPAPGPPGINVIPPELFLLSAPARLLTPAQPKMTLEDFEKSLADDQERRRERSDKDRHHRDRSKDRSRHRHHRSSHHHRRHSSRSRDRERDRDRDSRHRSDDRHRHKRSRHSTDHGDDDHTEKRRHRDVSQDQGEAPAKVVQEEPSGLKRDSWMEAPSALDVDYVQRRDTTKLEEAVKPKMLSADYELKIHNKELNSHLRDLKDGKALEDIAEEPAQHEVDYTFGDAGSQWRMTKLKGVYREAEESGRPVDDVALDRFGDLRSFDDAREEETEMDRRKMYGKSYVGKDKPSGELFQERKVANDLTRDRQEHVRDPEQELSATGQGQKMDTEPPANTTQPLDLTALNRLKAQMMKAKLKKAPDAAELEAQYNAAAASMANRKEKDVVVLGIQQNPMLAAARGEVKSVDTKRGRERGHVEENEDMSIEDMVREERKTRGQAGREGQSLAERIAKDGKFEVSFVSLFMEILRFP